MSALRRPVKTLVVLPALALFASAASRAHAADAIEKLNGITLRGEVVERKPEKVRIRISLPGGGDVEMTVPVKDIHAVTVKGVREVLNEKREAPKPRPRPAPRRAPRPAAVRRPTPKPKPKPKPSPGNTRTREEVLALIKKAGETKPEWWDSVQLTYPKTLDLSWPRPSGGGWNTQRNVGQYMWSIINENPRRWKDGTKFMHYVLKLNEGNPEAHRKAMGSLAHCYHDLLGDWARGAYWYMKDGGGEFHKLIGLADSYWKLGSKDMAAGLLARITYDSSRYCSAVKLWSDMGELEKALALAAASARGMRPESALMAAGDACRKHGRYRAAVVYYQKALAIPVRQKDGIQQKTRDRAQAAVRNIKVFETLDLRRVRSGTYTGTGIAYAGPLTVSVTVQGGRIAAVRVTGHRDKQYFTSVTDTPKQIVEKQSLKDVDATTGATLTSDGIVNAVADALGKVLN
ncbi:MAG: FMN-binding protein [Planctomycetota bacterium]